MALLGTAYGVPVNAARCIGQRHTLRLVLPHVVLPDVPRRFLAKSVLAFAVLYALLPLSCCPALKCCVITY